MNKIDFSSGNKIAYNLKTSPKILIFENCPNICCIG